MKYFALTSVLLCCVVFLHAQKDYPATEFSNEIYYLKKDSVNSVIRLEKGISKMESKTKMGGFGGAESGYEMEGSKSSVRFGSGNNLSFVFSNSTATVSSGSVAQRDSMMRANGIDPSMMESMSDPSNMITLHKAETSKDKRKVLVSKTPGMMPFGSKKMKSGDKFSYSIKKIRQGYWELVIDKPLPRGEYIFTMMNMSSGNMDGSTLMFAFAID
jgi:hypothetical protein